MPAPPLKQVVWKPAAPASAWLQGAETGRDAVLGYFTNCLARVNSYIERENKRGSDIPRFTKAQIRLIVRYLERREIFVRRHAMGCDGRRCRCDELRRREFIRVLRTLNRKLPRAVLEALI